MSAKHNFRFDETKFKPRQREAAMLLVQREFAPKSDRRRKTDIADELEISKNTLYQWEHHDPNFIAYKNYLASEMMDTHLGMVYSVLLDVIRDGNTKGIELFLKRIGDLDSKSEVTINQGQTEEKSYSERKAELLSRIGEEVKEDDADIE